MVIPQEIRDHYKEVMGEDLPDDVVLMAKLWATYISGLNRHRKP